MRYVVSTVLATALGAGLLSVAEPAHAGDLGIVGNWKINIYEDGQILNFWILKVQKSDKAGITGQVVPLKRVPPSALEDFRLTDNIIHFKIRLANQILFEFEGRLPPAGSKKIYGSLTRGGQSHPTILTATKASNQFELDRELLARNPTDPGVFSAAFDLLGNAKAEKATSAEVQQWVETAMRSADLYGPRWQSDVSLKLLDKLTPEWNEAALNLTNKIIAKLDPKTPLTTQIRLLEIQSQALLALNKPAEAGKVISTIDRLESVAYADYSKTSQKFPLERFAGRKGDSQRGVLVELFTGAQCPPCVAADMAFDALERTYKTKDVVLLQYHLHVPGPDPLTNPAAEQRAEYYAGAVRGTPAILFDGKSAAPGGGGIIHAQDKYKEYLSVINPLLEKKTPINLVAQAARQGNKVIIRVNVEGVPMPGEKTKLRVVLVEDWVRYKARNGLSYHHRVVRAFAGGPEGVALDKKDSVHNLSIDLTGLLQETNKYLDAFAANEGDFPDAQRPLRLQNLHIVALVQDDATKDVLNAVDTAVVPQN